MRLLYERLRTSRGVLVALLLGFMLLAASVVQAQTVTTNKADYYPGETVTITGSGWTNDADVLLVIEHLIFTNHENDTLTAIVTSGGFINDAYIISSLDLGEQFRLAAIGQTSGKTAVTYFTDGEAIDGGGTMTVSPTIVCSSSDYRFTFESGNRTFESGSLVTLEIPNGYAQPTVGNIVITPYGGASASLNSISTGSAPWTITVNFSCDNGNGKGFYLDYTSIPKPVNGTYTFITKTDNSGDSPGTGLTNISTQPSVVVGVPLGGTLSGGFSSCTSSASGTLTLTGYNGTIAWYYSTTSASGPWTSVSGGGVPGHPEQLQLNNIDITTWYRVTVTLGTCIAYSNVEAVYITTTPGLTILPSVLNVPNPSTSTSFGEGINVTVVSPIAYTVTYILDGTYNAGPPPSVTGGTVITSPRIFTGGIHTVYVVATNFCGSTIGSFTVNVGIPPQITCPLPATVNTSTYVTGDCEGTYSSTLTWDGSSATATPITGHYIGNPQPLVTYTVDGGGSATTWTGTVNLNKGEHTIALIATNAGGTASCSFTVTVVDNEKPVISPAASNMTVECDGAGNTASLTAWLGSHGGASATDNCDQSLTWTYSPNPAVLSDLCGATGAVTVTFTVTDDDANASSTVATFTIVDTTPPSITKAAVDKTVECNGTDNTAEYSAWLAAHADATASDVCGGTITWTSVEGSWVTGCGNTKSMTVTFYATDDCNNKSLGTSATFFIKDTHGPIFESDLCGTTVTKATDVGDCAYTAKESEFDVTAHDDCGGATLSWELTGATESSSTTTTLDGVVFNFGTTTVTWTAKDDCGSTSTCVFEVDVNKVTTITSVTVSPTTQEFSDLVELTATVTPYFCAKVGCEAAGVVTFEIEGVLMGQGDLVSGVATWSGSLCGDFGGLGENDIVATFIPSTEVCPYYLGSSGTTTMTIVRDKVCVDYSGVLVASTIIPTSDKFTVVLAATLRDLDGSACITGAQVNFYLNGSSTPINPTPLKVGLVNSSDPSTGTATYEFSGTLPPSGYSTYNVHTEVVGYYENDNTCDQGDAVVNVSKPMPDFITGGGFLVLTNKTSGIKAGDVGSKNNFGFNVKWNKSVKNLQGNINTIIRRTEADGYIHNWQVKGNSMTSLNVNANTKEAVFTGKASIFDVTDPTDKPGFVLGTGDGNATLQAQMADVAEPGKDKDLLAITVWNKSGGVWFTSNWNGVKTVTQAIAQGNLQVSLSSALKTAEVITQIDGKTDLLVYPNPFSDKLRFEFIAPNDTHALISLYDITGRMVQTVFDSEVKGGVDYNADFKPVTNVSGMYFYRATIGDQVFNGKVMYKK